MSNKSKGGRYESEVKAILEEQGWKVFQQHRKPMFLGPGRMITKGADIFGSDIVAKKQGEKPLWIQVSTIEHKQDKIKQMMEHPWTWEHERAQVWCRLHGKKEFRVFEGPDFEEIVSPPAWEIALK